MPLPQEKLICPLAVRFTQEHTRTTFRDNRVVEETAKEIQVQPSSDSDYDLVLVAPFPLIEVVRWEERWFTLDNRRLYCLQKAAMEHWPKRVAAKVEAHYDVSLDSIERKLDSTTMGESVTVAHSCKDAPLFRWDWCDEVPARELELLRWDQPESHNVVNAEISGAWDAVARDDERWDVDELPEVEEHAAPKNPEERRERMIEFELAQEAAATLAWETPKRAKCRTPSTSASDASDAASEESDGSPSFGRGDGSDDGCPLEARALEEIRAQLRASGADGWLRISNWHERFGEQLGPLRKFIEARPDQFLLVPERQGKFKVFESLAQLAVGEIRAQLQEKGGVGHVQIDDWYGRYSWSLGSFKAFVRGRPHDFKVAQDGKLFKVALAPCFE